MNIYLAIKRLRATHVNAMTSFNVIGAPAITAHLGFAGAISHRFGLETSRVCILHHGQDFEGEYHTNVLTLNRLRGGPLQINSEKKGGKRKQLELSDQPMAFSNYEVSLVIELVGEYENIQALNYADNSNCLGSWLKSGARFAGGIIQDVSKIAIFESLEDALKFLPGDGYWVIDRRDIIENREEGKDILETSIQNIYPKVRDEKSPWLAMSQVGFIRVTPLEFRGGVRQNLPHAYVEPLLGLIEYRSNRLIPTQKLIDEPIFWSYQQPTDNSYVAQSNYL